MTSARPTPVDRQRTFLPHELFFSTTDRKGVITFGNHVFTRISGYPAERLVGAPHNIIRHPDMPRAVFKLFWEYLLSGRSIVAYVKNMAADGAYYWVLTLVAPSAEGFLSIRLKPCGPLFDAVGGVYREMCQIEEDFATRGKPPADGMSASTDHLVHTLASLGFDGYDPFMQQLLVSEVTTRKRLLKENAAARIDDDPAVAGTGELATLRARCAAIEAQVAALFAKLDTFLSLEKALADKTAFVASLGHGLQVQSLNAQVRAAGLRDEGRTLQVIAEQMSASSRGTSESALGICRDIADVTCALRDAAFRIATSDLSVEMMSQFLGELRDAPGGGVAHVRHHIGQLAEVVSANLDQTCRCVDAASAHVRRFEQRLATFLREIRTLEILHITGKVEAVRCRDGANVSSIFLEVYQQTKSARQELTALAELAAGAQIAPPDRGALDRDLSALRAA